jgi:predicted heme/steroid binding protein
VAVRFQGHEEKVLRRAYDLRRDVSEPRVIIMTEQETPIDPFYLVLPVIIFLALYYLIGRDNQQAPVPVMEIRKAAEKMPPPIVREITREEVRKFDGSNPEKPIYLVCMDDVFDVSSSDNYKPGKSYNCFAGRDASVALAKMSFKEEDLADPNWRRFKGELKETLEGWHQQFSGKYPVVGQLASKKED